MATGKRFFWSSFWLLAIVIAGMISWFFGNLLYSLLWKELADYGFPVSEAQMLGYIGAHLTPFFLTIIAAAILGVLIRNQLANVTVAAPSTVIQQLPAYVPPPSVTAVKLKCSFSMNDAGCVRRNTIYNEYIFVNGVQRVKHIGCDWYRLRVDAEGGNIAGCRGRLISVKRGTSELLIGENPPLPFTHHNNPDEGLTVCEGVSEFLDLLGILYDQRIDLAIPPNRRTSSVHWGDMFSLPGLYEIRVMVTAPSVAAAPIDLLLHWNLQPSSARIELKNQEQQSQSFRITIGTDPSFYELVGYRNLYSLTKRFKLKIENPDRSKMLTGCKISILSIDPSPGNRSPWILQEKFELPAGDQILVPLVSYQERREPEKYRENPTVADTFEICCTNEHKPLLSIESQHILHIRCTAQNMPFHDERIKLSVVEGRMRIEKI